MESTDSLPLALAVVSLLLLTPALLVHQFLLAPVTVDGSVEAKVVTGLVDGTRTTMLSATGDGVETGSGFAGTVDAALPVQVNDSLAARFERDGLAAVYAVTLRLPDGDPMHGVPPGGSMAYTTDRATFNELRVGDTARVAVARSGPPFIAGITR